MKKSIFIVLLFITSAISGQIEWNKFEEDSIKAGNKELILLYFTADWCTWCRQLNLKMFSEEAVIKIMNDNIYAIKINESNKYDLHTINKQNISGKELAYQIGINTYPTIIITDKNLIEIKKINGFIQPEEFVVLLNKLRKNEHN